MRAALRKLALILPGTTCWDEFAAWWLVHQRGAKKPNWVWLWRATSRAIPGSRWSRMMVRSRPVVAQSPPRGAIE